MMKKTGEYRNLTRRGDLWFFDVKLKSGEWKSFTGLMTDSKEDAEKFAQSTADGWVKK
jgi:hypothetical protein